MTVGRASLAVLLVGVGASAAAAVYAHHEQYAETVFLETTGQLLIRAQAAASRTHNFFDAYDKAMRTLAESLR